MAEYITDLGFGGFGIYQDSEGYSFSQDSIILANLAKFSSADRVLDLGSGCGILSFVAVLKKRAAYALGIDVQPRAVELAKKSADLCSANGKIDFLLGDVKDVKTLVPAGGFDKVLCNPPYFNSTQACKNDEKALSRAESTASLFDFVNAAAYALKFGGDLYIIQKAERLATLMSLLKDCRLEPKELVLIYPKRSKGVDGVLLKARKGAKEGLKVSSLVVMKENGEYTKRFKELYD